MIDAAYRRLASKYHPDKDPSPSALGRMKEINAAYEILKDPERRAEYDRRRERLRTQRPRHEAKPMEPPISTAPSPSPMASQELAAEVSNRVFKKVLWAAAFIAFLIYFQWGIPLLLAAWGVIWLVKRHPGGAAKFLQWGLTAGIAFGVYFWLRPRSENESQQKTEQQMAGVDIQAMLDREMGAFRGSCVKAASKDRRSLLTPIVPVWRTRSELSSMPRRSPPIRSKTIGSSSRHDLRLRRQIKLRRARAWTRHGRSLRCQ